MGTVASQITKLTIVYSTVYSYKRNTQKLRVTGLSAGNSPVTGEFPAQMAGYAEMFPFWWRHYELEYARVITFSRTPYGVIIQTFPLHLDNYGKLNGCRV